MFNLQLKYKNDIIPGYLMNDKSYIYSLNSNKILRPFNNKEGKPVVALLYNGKKTALRLDYLVLSTHNRYYDDIIRAVHLDEDDSNCSINNLMALRKVDIINKYKEMYNVDNLEEIDEVWKLHPEVTSVEISNFGNIRDVKTKISIAPYNSHGYMILYKNNHNYPVHKLVADLFVDNPKPGEYLFINHLDGDKSNNKFYNLEWCNIPMNTEHAALTGLFKSYEDATIQNVCKLLSEGISHTKISIITGVSRKYISDIYRGRRQKRISKNYSIHRKPSLSEKYNKDAIIALMESGYKPKEISAILHLDYSQSFISYYERLKRLMRCSNR